MNKKIKHLPSFINTRIIFIPLVTIVSLFFFFKLDVSAAVLDTEILSNITTSNDSGTTAENPWIADSSLRNINFIIHGEEVFNNSVVAGEKKQAVLIIPSVLRGRVNAGDAALINTNVTIDLSRVTFLTPILNAANDLTNVITKITSGTFGNLTGVNIDLTEVNRQLELINNIENLGAASFSTSETLAADGSYISASISDGLGLVLALNVSKILQDLNAAVQTLEAEGTGFFSNIVAEAINAALLPVKGTVKGAVSAALPLLETGGSGVNELADASLLGTTTVTLPTIVSFPQNITNNLDARFVGTVVQTNFLNISLLSTATSISNIYFSADNTHENTHGVTTDGQIHFTPSTDEPEIVVPPVEEPDVEIEPEVPGTTGPLSIVKAATMNFGSQVISNQDQTYNMVAERQQKTGTTGEENKVPFISFAQVSDTRGSNVGWDLKVSLSDFQAENTQNAVLRGAKVTLKDPQIQYTGNNQELAPAAHANNLELLPNSGAVSVMTAESSKGAGRSSVVWGNQAGLDAQFEADPNTPVTNNAIQLSVPGATAKDATTYTSTLTWELTTTPGSDVGA